MNFGLATYLSANDDEKFQLIQQNLLKLSGKDFEKFLVVVFLDCASDARNLAVKLLSENGDKAWIAAQFLLTAKNPADTLSSLTYFGARIIEAAGSKIHFSNSIPLLVAAYNTDDYRDSRWAIAHALAAIAKEPLLLIKESIGKKPKDEAELMVHFRSYTTIDLEFIR